MFENKYLVHLESENEWLKKQIEELQQKLFRAMRLSIEPSKELPRMKWNGEKLVEMTEEEIHSESQALQDLLSQNV